MADNPETISSKTAEEREPGSKGGVTAQWTGLDRTPPTRQDKGSSTSGEGENRH